MASFENKNRQRFITLESVSIFQDIDVLGNNKWRIENTLLTLIMNKVLEVKNGFNDISFHHIYREFNSKVNQLSKEALLLQKGFLSKQEFRGGTQITNSERSLYFVKVENDLFSGCYMGFVIGSLTKF